MPVPPRTSAASLPLMGIGNVDWLEAEVLQELWLITPHGDRKPTRASPALASWHRLITPHGDRKRAANGHETNIGPYAHYPSWGSETRRQSDRGSRAGSAHYPSWGSETARSRGRDDALPELITPHGDRKHHYGCGRRSGGRSSLPLMGIGNTPHITWVSRMSLSSLPLMGIGNRYSSLDRWRRRSLSLPLMGIGNPTVGRAWRVGSRASLPLMGIGNGVVGIHAHKVPPHSLPLMGIGNRGNPGSGTRARRGLITPHGDRKRGYVGVGVIGHQAHLITPHGDRKHAHRRYRQSHTVARQSG